MNIGVISGSEPPNLINDSDKVSVDTVYGSVQVKISDIEGNKVFYISRHGPEANRPPHKVNYRANIQALTASNVKYIISFGTVGSLNKKMIPGHIVIPNDFIDITKKRDYTFHDDKRVHIDMSHPFCNELRNAVIDQAEKSSSITIHEKGTYLVTEGPRLETPAEIRMYQSFADIVGMTLVPEVVLARENGICYVSLCLICNMAAGLQSSLPASEISQIFTQKASVISELLKHLILTYKPKDSCICKTDYSMASL
jgi:5'-methylthioadenosine phosphorylase